MTPVNPEPTSDEWGLFFPLAVDGNQKSGEKTTWKCIKPWK